MAAHYEPGGKWAEQSRVLADLAVAADGLGLRAEFDVVLTDRRNWTKLRSAKSRAHSMSFEDTALSTMSSDELICLFFADSVGVGKDNQLVAKLREILAEREKAARKARRAKKAAQAAEELERLRAAELRPRFDNLERLRVQLQVADEKIAELEAQLEANQDRIRAADSEIIRREKRSGHVAFAAAVLGLVGFACLAAALALRSDRDEARSRAESLCAESAEAHQVVENEFNADLTEYLEVGGNCVPEWELPWKRPAD